eukprot:GHVP01065685.1.p1 GENE.GHVP01065685.1~~GHVP01065685.1.p1  ORF type:complete len:280 (+),score=7.73 GHVP01065685.1:69-908(+)
MFLCLRFCSITHLYLDNDQNDYFEKGICKLQGKPRCLRLRISKPTSLRITSILASFADAIDPENQTPLSTSPINLFIPLTLQLNSFFRIAYRSTPQSIHFTLATKDIQSSITDSTTAKDFLDLLTNATQSSYLQNEPLSPSSRPGQLYTLEENTTLAVGTPDASVIRDRTLRSFFNIIALAAIRKHKTEKSQERAHKAIAFELTTFVNLVYFMDPTIDLMPIIKEIIERRKEDLDILKHIRIPTWHSHTDSESFTRHRPRNPTDFTPSYEVQSNPSEDI